MRIMWRLLFFLPLLICGPSHAQQLTEQQYRQFFPRSGCSKAAYEYAARGYQILYHRALLANPRYLTIIDFSKPSNRKRLFVLDLKSKRVVVESITSHGIGSDPDSVTIPQRFSNRNGSRASSVGFYITGATYTNQRPQDNLGLCLFGLDKGFNDSAAIREVVIHYGASESSGHIYVTDSGAARSYGCPALPLSTNSRVIQLIKGGSVLFIYSPKVANYMRRSAVLNNELPATIVQRGPPPNNCSCNLRTVNVKH
jgi:hypothetical protein